jgi:hypothetical protein
MVNFKKLTDKAKDAVDKRGGTDALKADAKEVGSIFKGKGSLKEKAQKAKEAVSDPGEKGSDRQAGSPTADKHEAGAEARQHGGTAKSGAAGKTEPADAVGVSHAQPPVDSADEADKRN